MTTAEWLVINKRLTFAFPGLSGDRDRQEYLFRELSAFRPGTVDQAITEFLQRPNADGKLYTDQIRAIAYRLDRELMEREAAIAKALDRQNDREQAKRIGHTLDSVTVFIADMSDDEVMTEWRKVVDRMAAGITRTWCEAYAAAKVRTNVRFQLHIAELRKAQRVA
jgi:hypothetical protein